MLLVVGSGVILLGRRSDQARLCPVKLPLTKVSSIIGRAVATGVHEALWIGPSYILFARGSSRLND